MPAKDMGRGGRVWEGMVTKTGRDEILERQADIIDATLIQRGVEARVTGGVLHSRWVRFQVEASPEAGRRIEALAEELVQALDVETCLVSLQDGGAMVQIPRSDPQPVRLLSLLATLARRGDRMLFATAVLGLTDDVRPLLARLPSAEVRHVLITGAAGSGKSTLVRAIVVSLALHHRRSRLSFVLIGGEFGPLAGLSGLLRPVVRPEETARALRSLVGLMDLRVREGRLLAGDGRSGDPRVVVVLDELADLDDAHEDLAQLVRGGHEAGIHLVVCAEDAAGLAAGGLAEDDFPLRLVGQATGKDGALPGDFVAVTDEQETHICAAYISAQETAKVMAQNMQVERGRLMKAPPRPTVHRRPGRPGRDRLRRPADRMRAVRRWRDEMATKARQKTATRTAAGRGGAEMATQLNQTQHRPDALAERIEEMLRGRGIQTRVVGGNTYPDCVQFHVVSAAPPDMTGMEKIEGLAGELALALDVETCHVSRRGGLVAIEVPYAVRPAQLPPLQKLMAPFQAQGVALLGTSDGRAVPVRLFDRDVRHLFVSAAAGGRNYLTRSVVASLAASHSRRQLSFVLIAPGRRSNFGTLAGLPHLWGPVLSEAEETIRALDVLDRRILSGLAEPRTVVVIDDLADLLAMPGANGKVSKLLRRMTQRGHEAGVHVVACTGRPSDLSVQDLFRTGNFPVRLVGWMASPGDAGAASHYAGPAAGRLPGLKPGDFIIAAGGGQAHVCRTARLTGIEIAQLVEHQMKKHSHQFNTQVVTHPWGIRVVPKRRKQPQVGLVYTLWLYYKLGQHWTNRLLGRQKDGKNNTAPRTVGGPQTRSVPDIAGAPGR